VDPNVDMKTPPVEQLQKMDASAFFSRMAAVMKSNPAPASEAAIVEKLAKIGIVPGQKFDRRSSTRISRRGWRSRAGRDGETGRRFEGDRRAGQRLARAPMILGNFGSEYGVRAVRRADRPGCQRAQGRRLSVRVRRRRGQAALRREQIRAAFRQGEERR